MFRAAVPGCGGARLLLPGIFPYFVTGALTASGGSWNASIVAEVASWGDTKLEAPGLGAYIANATDAGDYPRVVARHRGDVDLRDRLQPPALAAALSAGRTPLPSRLRKCSPWKRSPPRPSSRPGRGQRRRASLSQGRRRRTAWCCDDVNLSLQPNEIVGLLGRSGSGKSTLLRIIAGLITPDRRRRHIARRAGRRARPTASPWCSRASPCFPG